MHKLADIQDFLEFQNNSCTKLVSVVSYHDKSYVCGEQKASFKDNGSYLRQYNIDNGNRICSK